MSLSVDKVRISNAELSLFEDFSFSVKRGEILTLMGPSGCGKSTMLSFICGALSKNDFDYSGKVYLEGEEISHLPIQKRKIGILFQDDLLFPHMNVEENLTFAIPNVYSKSEKKKKVELFLQSAQMEKFKNKNAQTLSGGQKARINLLRALLAEPKALLLDEPFSKLDSTLKEKVKSFVYDFIKKIDIPTVLVTHDKSDVPDDNLKNLVRLK